LLVGAFLFGVVYAQTTVQTPLLVRAAFGSADYPAIYSRVSMAGSLMSAVAAVFWSVVIDSAGGFPLMFVLGIACMAVCLATALFALSHRASV
ncbi:MAG: MFS transporter, partial [Coriobacteriaceae bacterium]